MGHDGAVTAIPPRPVVGVLHPGAMGAAIGSALRPRAGAVIWAAAGRSQATSKRAELADLVAVPDVAALARRSDVILSVCPPHAARETARGGRRGPRRDGPQPDLRRRERRVAVDGARDRGRGSARTGSSTGRSSGRRRGSAGTRCCGWPGRRPPTSPPCSPAHPSTPGSWAPTLGTASALKACFALQSKALPAIWLEMAAAARGFGVEKELRGELERNGVDFAAALAGAGGGAAKAWRWAGEMDEAADAVAAVGLPDGFSRAAAEIYRRLADGRLEP